MHITLKDFEMAGFMFKQTKRLEKTHRLLAEDFIIEAVRNIPDTTTCDGDLKDPRCPEGNGDITNILLAAFDANGEMKGALHFGAIVLKGRIDAKVLEVETHPTPWFPGLSPREFGALCVEMALFVTKNNLSSFEGNELKITALNYAVEKPFAVGGKFEESNRAMMKGLEFTTTDDPTRPGRKLHNARPKPDVVVREVRRFR